MEKLEAFELLQEAAKKDLSSKSCFEKGDIHWLARCLYDRRRSLETDLVHLLRCPHCLLRWAEEKRKLKDEGISQIWHSREYMEEIVDELIDKSIKKELHLKAGLSLEVYRERFNELKVEILSCGELFTYSDFIVIKITDPLIIVDSYANNLLLRTKKAELFGVTKEEMEASKRRVSYRKPPSNAHVEGKEIIYASFVDPNVVYRDRDLSGRKWSD
jgi:hypothetical protein